MCPDISAPDPAPSGPALTGRRVLVVEDEYFLADDIARALVGLGAETVGPVPTREQALAHLEGGGRIDACVLDLNLRGEMAFPVADALLARIKEKDRARLRIYIGAAPGVGKTYEMLQEAHALRARGLDVVIGYVETYGRRETEAQLKDLEIVPRRNVEHRGASGLAAFLRGQLALP